MIDENTIQVTKYEVLGKLPELLKHENGEKVTRESWESRRKELYKYAVDFQYGGMPPEPEFLEVEERYRPGRSSDIPHGVYDIITGRRDHPIRLTMRVIGKAHDGEKRAAVIDGDLCFNYVFDKEYINTFADGNVLLVMFDRTELAYDELAYVPLNELDRKKGQIYECYPDMSFGAIAAWAWGYSRCVDALEKLGIADMENIAFSGHSRGGKTTALAGAVDRRAAIVNPNETNACGCGCYRIHMEALTEDGELKRSETLADQCRKFPFWIGPEMLKYAEREQDLPFDSHFLKAMVAPRILLVGEAASDIWGNPIGSWQTTMAAKQAFDLLGASDNLLWYFRNGYHNHKTEDLDQLINVIRHRKYGEPLNDRYFKTPFKKPNPIF